MITRQQTARLMKCFTDALNRNVVGVNHEFWTEDMVWRGNAGLGTKYGVDEFERDIRAPFIAAFPDKVAKHDVYVISDGYVACAGHQVATHANDWLGIPATGRRTTVRYIDIWRLEEVDGEPKLAENWVDIDILGVMQQAGYDVGKVLGFVGSKPPEFFENAGY